jgi:subtilisin family serine protease
VSFVVVARQADQRKGINDVVDDHIAKRGKLVGFFLQKLPKLLELIFEIQGYKGSVINMSLGWVGADHATYMALYRAYQEGITTVVSAGNKNTDTENVFPCA